MKIYELLFGKGDSIEAMSLVESPAMEEEALFLASEKLEVKLSIDSEKQEIVGVAMIPDKPIYRKSASGEDFYIFFSKETVSQSMDSFMQPNKKNSFTLEHEEPTSEVVALESWIQKDNDPYNLNAPEGSWILRSHVPNKEYWNKVIKAGSFTGYSIEGKFGNKVAREELSSDVLEFLVDGIKNLLTNHYNN
jgi:hypothetical protein